MNSKDKIYFLVWSFEHDSWWRADWNGYTKNIDEAGRYLYASCLKILDSGNMHKDRINEAIVPITGYLKESLEGRQK